MGRGLVDVRLIGGGRIAREMKDRLDPVEQRRQGAGIRQVAPPAVDRTRRATGTRARSGSRVRIETRAPLLQQRPHQAPADLAGRAGHQDGSSVNLATSRCPWHAGRGAERPSAPRPSVADLRLRPLRGATLTSPAARRRADPQRNGK